MISCENLSISFKNSELFNALHVKIDSHVSILGENGAGKSSLAKAICNFIDYEGDVYLNNINTTHFTAKELAKEICYIPAKLENFDKYLRVLDFVLMGRYLYKPSFLDYSQEDRNKVRKILESLSLLHLQESYIDSISSGEAQLLLIAQALLTSSKILIFDEPTANLDPKNSFKIFTLLQSLKATHHIILITHDIHLAQHFNEDILFVQNGSITPYTKNDFFKAELLSQLYTCKFDEELRVAYV